MKLEVDNNSSTMFVLFEMMPIRVYVFIYFMQTGEDESQEIVCEYARSVEEEKPIYLLIEIAILYNYQYTIISRIPVTKKKFTPLAITHHSHLTSR